MGGGLFHCVGSPKSQRAGSGRADDAVCGVVHGGEIRLPDVGVPAGHKVGVWAFGLL